MKELLLQPYRSSQDDLETLVTQVYEAADWPSRFSSLMRLAAGLPPVATDLRAPEWEVFGCATRTWMRIERDTSEKIHLQTDAQSRLMQGLLYLIAHEVNGKQVEQINVEQVEDRLIELGFASQLSQTRGNAIRHLLSHLRSLIAG